MATRIYLLYLAVLFVFSQLFRVMRYNNEPWRNPLHCVCVNSAGAAQTSQVLWHPLSLQRKRDREGARGQK